MARKNVNGTIVAIGSAFGATKAISAISNATAAVFTFEASHGIDVGDYFQLDACGWPQLAGRVFRASAVATNDVTVAGLDTSSTTRYPAGAGAGSAREVTTWTPIQQINADGLTVDGGERQYLEGQYIDSDLQFRSPTLKTAVNIAMVVDDDQSLTHWTAVRAAEDSLANYPIRFTYPGGGGFAVGTGIWSVSAAPAMTGNNVQKRTISVALASVFSEYTS